MVNTCQQVGGAVGTAVLSSVFANAAEDRASGRLQTPDVLSAAQVHGYTTAFTYAMGLFLLGLLVAAVVLPRSVRPARSPMAGPVAEPARPGPRRA